jgi:hypothetical protein
LLSPTTFENLKNTLTISFSLEAEFTISFKDDENDWVLLTTEEELDYAIELSSSPLRLQIRLNSSEPARAAPTTENRFTARGRGRGCRGQGFRGRDKAVAGKGLKRKEKVSQKASRLSERIDMLETKLNSKKFTSERETVIRRKLAQLQANLAIVKATGDSLPNSDTPQEPVASALSEPVPTDETPVEPETPQRRGGPRMRGRGCGRMGGSDRPKRPYKGQVAPEIIENFRQCRARLQEARASGNAEELEASLAAFQVSRSAKREALTALRAQDATNDEQKA